MEQEQEIDLAATWKFIDDHKQEIIEDWQTFVNLASWGFDPKNVTIASAWLRDQFTAAGVPSELVPCQPNGDAVRGMTTYSSDRKPLLFTGHLDTAVEKAVPFKIEDGKAYGAGVLDMKGGIIISLWVIKALLAQGYNYRPIKILFVGDEEIIHQGAETSDLIMKEAAGCQYAFNLETGRIDGSLSIGRNGRIGLGVEIEGKASHAGNDFSSGINAIEEAAYKIIELRKLTDLSEGVTVSTNTIKGGSWANTIAGSASLEVDIRFSKAHMRKILDEKTNLIIQTSYVDGTHAKLNYKTVMDAFETNDQVRKFLTFAQKTSEKYGFGKIGGIHLGGSSDASYILLAGTPVLCAIGVVGQWNHTEKEYAIVESMFDRAKLILSMVHDAGDQDFS